MKTKVHGLILRPGYVESSRPYSLIVRHIGGYFPSVHEALADFAFYTFENWAEYNEPIEDEPDEDVNERLEEFQWFIQHLGDAVASATFGQQTWDRAHTNCEQWWPWNSITELYRHGIIDHLYENTSGIPDHIVLPQYLDIERIPDGVFKNDLAQFQSNIGNIWPREQCLKAFQCIKPNKKRRK